MNERQQRRILYAADEIKELIDTLKDATGCVKTEIEDLPIESGNNKEKLELRVARKIMAVAERLDRDLNMLYAVKRFSATPEKETYLTYKY